MVGDAGGCEALTGLQAHDRLQIGIGHDAEGVVDHDHQHLLHGADGDAPPGLRGHDASEQRYSRHVYPHPRR
jgi:hypothetical protein